MCVCVCVCVCVCAGLEEMLANIRRQHEAWTDYLAEAGQGTLPYSHVTVTRPQQYVKHAKLACV